LNPAIPEQLAQVVQAFRPLLNAQEIHYCPTLKTGRKVAADIGTLKSIASFDLPGASFD